MLRQERGKNGEFNTVRFHVYVPRVLIGLTELPPVVQQRTIEMTLHRRHQGEEVERYRSEERRQEETALREACALYALTYCRQIAEQYRRVEMAEVFERRLRQAGRLVYDLLLPLFAVAAGAVDGDKRSRNVIFPVLESFMSEIAPAISKDWNEGANMSPAWLGPSLDILEQERTGALTPADLAALLYRQTGIQLSPVQLSRNLKKYEIHSDKKNGRRAFFVPPAQIEQVRARYVAPTGSEETP